MKVMKLTKQMQDRELPSRLKAICMMKAFEVTQSMSKKERKNYIMKDIIHTMINNLSDDEIRELAEDLPNELIEITTKKIEADEVRDEYLN